MTHYSIRKAEIAAQLRRNILYASTPPYPETRQVRRARDRAIEKQARSAAKVEARKAKKRRAS